MAEEIAMTLQLSKRLAQPDGAQVNELQWHSHELPDSNAFVEYIPGRDNLYTAEQLAAGKPHAMCRLNAHHYFTCLVQNLTALLDRC